MINYLTKGILHIHEYLILVLIGVPVVELFNKYIFSDWEFASFLLVMIVMDTSLGVWVAWKDKTLSSKKFSGFFTKIIQYFIFLTVIHICTNFTSNGEKVALLAWLDSVGYTALIVRESLSIIEKLARINPDLVPQWITKRLKDFDDDGELNNSVK